MWAKAGKTVAVGVLALWCAFVGASAAQGDWLVSVETASLLGGAWLLFCAAFVWRERDEGLLVPGRGDVAADSGDSVHGAVRTD